MTISRFTLITLAVLVGCSGKELVVERHANGQKLAEGYVLEDGTRMGRWTRWYGNGQKQSEGVYEDGKLEGTWTEWWANGEKWRETQFEQGENVGGQDFEPPGERKNIENFVDTYELGKKRFEGALKNGKPEGFWTYWHRNGQKYYQGALRNGKPDGPWTVWYLDGQKQFDGVLVNGEPEGTWTYWHDNGQKKSEVRYKNGKEEGLWSYWHRSGAIANELEFRDGAPWNGLFPSLSRERDGDSLWETAEYKNGQQEGPWVHWHGNGQKQSEGSKNKGGEKEGPWVHWHDNGQKESEREYKDGEREGPWVYWRNNGQKESEGKYKGGGREGLWTTWHDNGQKESEGEYKNGWREGLWVFWHDSGQKESEGEYEDGGREGLWTYRNAKGELLFNESGIYSDGERVSDPPVWVVDEERKLSELGLPPINILATEGAHVGALSPPRLHPDGLREASQKERLNRDGADFHIQKRYGDVLYSVSSKAPPGSLYYEAGTYFIEVQQKGKAPLRADRNTDIYFPHTVFFLDPKRGSSFPLILVSLRAIGRANPPDFDWWSFDGKEIVCEDYGYEGFVDVKAGGFYLSNDGELLFEFSLYHESDPECCASGGYRTLIWDFYDKRWRVDPRQDGMYLPSNHTPGDFWNIPSRGIPTVARYYRTGSQSPPSFLQGR
jgi:antitoxin component YwqK of YwqJK toxin-antitoxin module